jgi:hypothetical protein
MRKNLTHTTREREREMKICLPGVPGKLLFLLPGFELRLGLGFEFGSSANPLPVEGTQSPPSDVICN